jgi:hypothetical protein
MADTAPTGMQYSLNTKNAVKILTKREVSLDNKHIIPYIKALLSLYIILWWVALFGLAAALGWGIWNKIGLDALAIYTYSDLIGQVYTLNVFAETRHADTTAWFACLMGAMVIGLTFNIWSLGEKLGFEERKKWFPRFDPIGLRRWAASLRVAKMDQQNLHPLRWMAYSLFAPFFWLLVAPAIGNVEVETNTLCAAILFGVFANLPSSEWLYQSFQTHSDENRILPHFNKYGWIAFCELILEWLILMSVFAFIWTLWPNIYKAFPWQSNIAFSLLFITLIGVHPYVLMRVLPYIGNRSEDYIVLSPWMENAVFWIWDLFAAGLSGGAIYGAIIWSPFFNAVESNEILMGK